MATTLSFWGIGNGVFVDWYLNTIVWLYILFPLLYGLIRKSGLIIVVPISAVCLIIMFKTSMPWEYECAIARIPIFMSGIYLHQNSFNKSNVILILIMFMVMLAINVLSGHNGTIYWIAPFMISALIIFFDKISYSQSVLSFVGRYTLEIYVANCITMTLTAIQKNSPWLWMFYILTNSVIAYCFFVINRYIGGYLRKTNN